LLAEDRVDNQQVVAQLLKQIGCSVAIAANGQLAVELFQSWQPDLILMDMRMPVMDGYQATRTIRGMPGGDNLPIVALTASAFEEERAKVLAAGCNELLSKPVDAQKLFEAIGRRLGLTYQYAGSAVEQAGAALTDFERLPQALRKELAEAAMILDVDAVMAVATQLAPAYPAEAERIAKLAGDFHFDKILELVNDHNESE